jgi:hypothetical protein
MRLLSWRRLQIIGVRGSHQLYDTIPKGLFELFAAPRPDPGIGGFAIETDPLRPSSSARVSR